jgi:hypothetical protein
VKQINDSSMDSSLIRSFRSLATAAALLMAAYAIAASPGSTTIEFPTEGRSGFGLVDVQQQLTFAPDRSRGPGVTASTGRGGEADMPVVSSLAWAFAGLCLVVALAQRRFVDR